MIGASEGGAIVGLWFVEEQRYLPAEIGTWTTRPDEPALHRLGTWIDAYFRAGNPAIDFPLAPRGTAFRAAVWERLRKIPYGQTTTYGKIAATLTASPRAVGGAVGHNPISLVVPCHRVIGKDGGLTGFGGGLWRKKALLELEGAL
jgi:methylated-DNA-[protein]-cysteine S-methyltransferase